MNKNVPPDHYILKRVTFGNRPSGAIAIVALRKTAEMFQNQFPESVKIIKNYSFVDDLIFCVDNLKDAISRKTEIETIIKEGGLEMKKWINSKNCKESNSIINMTHMKDKVLRVLWNSNLDQFRF